MTTPIIPQTQPQINSTTHHNSVRSTLSSGTVQDIIACAVYAATLGAHGMELEMIRGQWSERGQQLFDLALSGAKQGKEWAR